MGSSLRISATNAVTFSPGPDGGFGFNDGFAFAGFEPLASSPVVGETAAEVVAEAGFLDLVLIYTTETMFVAAALTQSPTAACRDRVSQMSC
jgi:hypothetical protein